MFGSTLEYPSRPMAGEWRNKMIKGGVGKGKGGTRMGKNCHPTAL